MTPRIRRATYTVAVTYDETFHDEHDLRYDIASALRNVGDDVDVQLEHVQRKTEA